MSLQKKENDLRKAQERLDKVNKRSKQFQIDFRREQNRNGRTGSSFAATRSRVNI